MDGDSSRSQVAITDLCNLPAKGFHPQAASGRCRSMVTMLNSLAGLTKWPFAAGLPMFEVMVVEIL